jgi:hypothetical protein
MIESKTSEQRVFVLLLCGLMVLAPVAPLRAQAEFLLGQVHSTVVLASTGEPVSGATIRLVNVATAQTVARDITSAEGVAVFSELAFGTYQVSLQPSAGYAGTASPLLMVDAENPSVEINIELRQAAADHDEIRMSSGSLLPFILVGIGAVGAAAVVVAVTEDGTG